MKYGMCLISTAKRFGERRGPPGHLNPMVSDLRHENTILALPLFP